MKLGKQEKVEVEAKVEKETKIVKKASLKLGLYYMNSLAYIENNIKIKPLNP